MNDYRPDDPAQNNVASADGQPVAPPPPIGLAQDLYSQPGYSTPAAPRKKKGKGPLLSLVAIILVAAIGIGLWVSPIGRVWRAENKAKDGDYASAVALLEGIDTPAANELRSAYLFAWAEEEAENGNYAFVVELTQGNITSEAVALRAYCLLKIRIKNPPPQDTRVIKSEFESIGTTLFNINKAALREDFLADITSLQRLHSSVNAAATLAAAAAYYYYTDMLLAYQALSIMANGRTTSISALSAYRDTALAAAKAYEMDFILLSGMALPESSYAASLLQEVYEVIGIVSRNIDSLVASGLSSNAPVYFTVDDYSNFLKSEYLYSYERGSTSYNLRYLEEAFFAAVAYKEFFLAV